MGDEECLGEIHGEAIAELMVLKDVDITANTDLFKRGLPASVSVMTNAQKRLLSYRKLFRLLFGIGRAKSKVKLPSCCRAHIVAKYFG
jgi:hypothetical protein